MKSKASFVIEVPAAFVAKIKRLTDQFDIPDSEILAGLTESVLSEQWTQDEDLWTSAHVYPDRASAARVAAQFFRRKPNRSDIELRYENEEGDEVEERFGNPLFSAEEKPAPEHEEAPLPVNRLKPTDTHCVPPESKAKNLPELSAYMQAAKTDAEREALAAAALCFEIMTPDEISEWQRRWPLFARFFKNGRKPGQS